MSADMLYSGDFTKSSRIQPLTNVENSVFSLTTHRRNNEQDENMEYDLVESAKPLIYFIRLFGMQTVRCFKNDVLKARLSLKFYSLVIILTIVLVASTIRPTSWQDTMEDPPLNILTKIYVTLQVIEVVHSIFITSICCNESYVKLFKKLSNVDAHYNIGKKFYCKRRLTAFFLLLLLIIQFSLTFWLRKFHFNNLLTQFTMTCLMLQGIFSSFILFNIYIHLLILNAILLNKINSNTKLPFGREYIFKDGLFNKLIKKMFINNSLLLYKRNYCWYEIMQIYDKITDCFSLFNQIYSYQVFIMFNTWLLCTILAICRAISPTIKYSQMYKSDIARFLSISFRPVILIKFSEYFIHERRKTLSIILHIMVHNNLDPDYFEQVQIMAELVKTRKLDISANVFRVEIPIMLNFAGNVISYSVILIQYFYMYVLRSL